MLSVDLCISPKITYVRAFFAWSVISLGNCFPLCSIMSSVTWREAPDFLPVLNTICGYETKSAKDPWSVFVVMHAPSLSVIRKTESTSAGTDGHCVPGLPSTASPDINQQSQIVLSLEPRTGYMTFPKVIQSVKNILPEIKCLGTEHSALKQFNKL